jgi:hypothetical protein
LEALILASDRAHWVCQTRYCWNRHIRSKGGGIQFATGAVVKHNFDPKRLRDRLPDAEIDAARAIDAIEKASEDETPDAVASVDLIAKQVSIIGRGIDRVAEQEILQNFLGRQILNDASPTAWPSQSDLAPKLDVTRHSRGKLGKARK